MLRDIISILEGYHQHGEEYAVQWNIFCRTKDIPPLLLMISFHCTDDIPPQYWIFLDELMISLHRPEDIPPSYWWYSSTYWIFLYVLMVSLHHTKDIPPLYWIPFTVLKISLLRNEWLNILHRTALTLPKVVESALKKESCSSVTLSFALAYSSDRLHQWMLNKNENSLVYSRDYVCNLGMKRAGCCCVAFYSLLSFNAYPPIEDPPNLTLCLMSANHETQSCRRTCFCIECRFLLPLKNI